MGLLLGRRTAQQGEASQGRAAARGGPFSEVGMGGIPAGPYSGCPLLNRQKSPQK